MQKAAEAWGVMISSVVLLLFPGQLSAQAVFGSLAVREYSLPTPGAGPGAIVMGPDGNLWFTEDSSGKIGRITLSGEIQEFDTPSGAQALGDITTGPDGNLWFTESLVEHVGTTPGNYVIKVSSIGRLTTLGAVTEFPVGVGELDRIVAGSDGNLWYLGGLPAQGGRVFRMTPEGSVVGEFFLGAGDITSGPDGSLWLAISNYTQSFISKFATSGTLTNYPVTGQESLHVTTGPDGALWFVEWISVGNERIGRLTTGGDFSDFPLPAGQFVRALTGAVDGNLWFVATDLSVSQWEVGRVTPQGVVTEFSLPSTSSPFDIVADRVGNIWFTEPDANKIGRFAIPIDRQTLSLPPLPLPPPTARVVGFRRDSPRVLVNQ